MKYSFLLLFTLLFISCGQDDLDEDPLYGDWVWVETINGWGGVVTPQSSDLDWELYIDEFDIQSIQTDLFNGNTVEENCSYSIELLPSIYSSQEEYHIIAGCPSVSSLGEIFYEVIDFNTLVFSYNCFDCPSHTFVRL